MVATPNYLTDGLVASVRNKYPNPASVSLYQDADILSLLDEEMRSDVIPSVTSTREDYWTSNYDQSITGTSQYTIPQRAAGQILRDVVFVDPSGNEIEMTRLSPTQIKATFPFGYQLPLYTFGFYLRDDKLVPYPQQAQTATQYTLRMKILRRPNNLTLSTNCGQITTIANNVLTLSNLDSTWTTATKFDIIANYSPFISINDDTVITNINTGASQITLSAVPTGLAVGMWVCPQYMTCLAQMPYEVYPYLVQLGIVALATGIGDSQGAELAGKKLKIIEQKLIGFLQPRVQGTSKKIVNRNRPNSFGVMGSPFLR